MEKILGIDLGTNSIGWAIRDTSENENQIIEKGVLTFDKGVGEVKGIEIPLVQARTQARGKRRNYQAEKYRKWELLKFLIEKKMCPLTIEELCVWKNYKKGVGRKYPQSEQFINWLRFDFNGDGKPDFELFGYDKHESYYVFRMLVVSESENDKTILNNNRHILGRVFYQLVQRRGYRGRDDESEEAKTILKGSEKNGTVGVNEIKPYIEEHRTLGSALYYLQKEKNERIRKRYNLRTDYEHELKEICRIQNIDDTDYKRLYKAIIWQRPLRSQKGLVGICTFEKNKARCPISHPLYEEYRTWVFINNLKIKLPEKIEYANYLKENIYPLFYNVSRDFKLSSVYKKLQKVGGEIKAKFTPDTKAISCTLLNIFEKYLGTDWKEKYGWNQSFENQPKNCPYSFEDIWHVLFSFDSNEKLKEFATQKLGLDEKKADEFSKIKLQQGYATLSLSAIKKIIPYLQQGFIYSEAIYLANLHKVLGVKQIEPDFIRNFSEIIKTIIKGHNIENLSVNVVNSLISNHINLGNLRFGMDANYQLAESDKNDILTKLNDVFGNKTWEEKPKDEKENILLFVEKNYETFLQKPINAKKENLFVKSGRLHDKIFQHLQDIYLIPHENKKYLWHPSEQETYRESKEINGIKVLGDPRPISNGFKNPMALRTLHELKKLINYLLHTHQIDEDTRIVVEIARELNDSNMRKAIEKYQRDREKENDEFKIKIKEINDEFKLNIPINDKEIVDKYRLWEEQKKQCLYTGKTINCKELFDGSKYNFEHTIPATLSFDNELKNLTIADIHYNMNIKANRIPTECPNYYKDTVEYTAIEPRLEFMVEKVSNLEKLLDEWLIKTKYASTKDIKDACIQRRHLIKFELDYWQKKLDTFTCKEYKAGWRNSQLRDTQIVTKYALPYLKTIFKKTEVQKGTITSAFKEIYDVKFSFEKKDRTKHSHHAIDAAILTLIPPSAIRDKILLRYNEEKDKHTHIIYHEKPRNWNNFKPDHILSIENEVLNNFQALHRTLIDTKKNVRKRGKLQFVTYTDNNGRKQFKLDNNENKIHLIAKGETIRGQLHKESFFGAIKLPETIEKNGKFIPVTDGNGNFVFQQNEKRKDNIFIVKREEDLSSFTKIEDFEIIIDPNLRQYFKTELQKRLNEGKTFANAMQEDIWAFGKKEDKNGNPIQPIRHIRCKVKGGGGGYINNPAIIKPFSAYVSKQEYKRNTYALNGETVVCAFYQSIVNNELVREIELYSILDISKTKNGKNLDNAVKANFEKTIKKEKHFIPLYATLKTGQKVLFYENELDELTALDTKELSKRLYLIVQFEDGKIRLKHHLNSMPEDKIKTEMKNRNLSDNGASIFDFANPIPKLRLSKSNFNFAIEGKHFNVMSDGEIKWNIV